MPDNTPNEYNPETHPGMEQTFYDVNFLGIISQYSAADVEAVTDNTIAEFAADLAAPAWTADDILTDLGG